MVTAFSYLVLSVENDSAKELLQLFFSLWRRKEIAPFATFLFVLSISFILFLLNQILQFLMTNPLPQNLKKDIL
jgi:hypothetical protein